MMTSSNWRLWQLHWLLCVLLLLLLLLSCCCCCCSGSVQQVHSHFAFFAQRQCGFQLLELISDTCPRHCSRCGATPPIVVAAGAVAAAAVFSL